MMILNVTILILIDGFLQYKGGKEMSVNFYSHNPYFNRWFSAIMYADISIIILRESQSLF